MSDALALAIGKFKTSKEFAEALGVSPQAVSQWDKVPYMRVLDVERLTGIPRHELRPDIYPLPLSDEQAAELRRGLG